ncbi:MAG TPA: nuclear transport factor 2 family protein [Devosia sp.]|nr:nuclear transport factor 2 family protein [Devosia sp.]
MAAGDAAAACIYEFHWRATVDGQQSAGRGRGTSVLARRTAGWQIVHEHLSAEPAGLG